ncbi:serine/threonine-protein kinase Nek10 isoform X2 [Nematostella vectensis]|uniref:serine/threonine-protein kinase Nek10 isoform X2 n=1 Tax=Nematostella vectensis TaxID=45351 RepID=UPI0020772E52|nr:serine/threonine-protein kinase Nek10 isoform X2 [Nematostella vectensis]
MLCHCFYCISDNHERESKDLSRLLELINTPASKQQLPSISWVADENQNAVTGSVIPTCHHQSTESLALERFSSRYQNVRNFTGHPQHVLLSQVFTSLVKNRVCCLEWTTRAPPENILRVLICLRMLMRDSAYQADFFNLGGVKILSERLQSLTENYLETGEEPFTVDILKEMTSICQKLTTDVKQREWMVACGTHKALVLLLSANDVIVLHCSLYALIGLAQSEKTRAVIGELNCTETLLRILQDYDVLSKTLSANLLRILCADSSIREQVKVFEGIPICLSLLHYDNLKLLWNLVWIIVQLAEDPDSSNDVRLLGGIPLLLALLQECRDRKSTTDSGYFSNGEMRSSASSETTNEMEPFEEQISLKCAVCAALTELVLNDTNGQQIVQHNGVYLLGVLILPQQRETGDEAAAVDNLQKSAFRALRFLFSMERNRQLFKRVFPPKLFEKFIDVGHYVRDLNAYKGLVEQVNHLPEEDIDIIRNNILAINQNKSATHLIGSYEVLELLGSGAFGSVYKVRKRHSGQSFLAMKEISIHSLGNTAKDRGTSVGEIVNETTIMREQLRHPNIVRYFKAFEEKEKLYIIMELVEGAPLGEHFNSLKEKGTRFSEERIWHIFIQIVLGLRYIHKEKHIVHRDLTPNNIMLGENDKVTITDFGLAKQKNPDASKMTSVVGTILYSCPEVVQSQPYGEKADVWAAGCILYQMATLQPPFYSSNMLALATKIVEASYAPIPSGLYSDKVAETVHRCLQAKPEDRPDIVQVAGGISEIMLTYVDKLRAYEIGLEKKLERERKRTQRHYLEATRNMQNYHRLFWASQERYDKLVNLSSSGGAVGLRGVNAAESDADSESNVSLASSGWSDRNEPLNDLQTYNSTSSSSKQNGSTSPVLSTARRVKKELTPLKNTAGDKTKGSPEKVRTKSEKGSSQVEFAVPKPPGPRKGARRLLNLDSLPANKAGSTGTLNSSGPRSPVVNCPSSVDIAVTRRTQSSSTVETYRRQQSTGGHLKARPPTAAATLSISPRKVRQINDPIAQILNQLHKIIFITQLPPTLSPNPQRRIVERFKRALFAPQSSSFNLKSEIKKVIEGSQELVDLNAGFGDSTHTLLHNSADKLASGGGVEAVDGQDIGITYEMIQNMIENVLMESGYYDVSPNARNRSVPLGPIGTNGAHGVPPSLTKRNSSI